MGGVNSSGKIFGSSSGGLLEHLCQNFDVTRDFDKATPESLYLAIDFSHREFELVRSLGIPQRNRFLLAFEPSVVIPWHYPKAMEKRFARTVWIGRGNTAESSPWPQLSELNLSSEGRIDVPVMIAGNKMSFEKGELYSLRRLAAREISPIKVYGAGWNEDFPWRIFRFARALTHRLLVEQRFPGRTNFDFLNTKIPSEAAANKKDAYGTYSVAIVIENSTEYCSEKVFDALRFGCIPIYVGNIDGLDKSLRGFVVKAGTDIASVKEAIQIAKSIHYPSWAKELQDAFDDDELWQRVSEKNVLSGLARKIDEWATA